MARSENILLIGAGKMGGALLDAWLKAGRPASTIAVLDTNPGTREHYSVRGCHVISDLEEAPDDPACIVLAVKPQGLDALLPELASFIAARRRTVFLFLRERSGERQRAPFAPLAPHPNPLPEGEGVNGALPEGEGAANAGGESEPLILSIAAGKTLGYFEALLPGASVIRAMPNTPAVIGSGISALCANALAGAQQKALAESLLRPAGEILWLEEEALMDAVTALSGSGPAYLFLFIEALASAGVSQGLPETTACQLALHTMRGSAELALRSDEPLAQLRRNVTSPGGTTQAALEVLMREDGLAELVHEAVAAAVKRAKELG